jgi:ABC-2 type transport system ATP-binding protein
LLVEIENICSHLAVMSRGKIVAQGSIEELSASPTLNLDVVTNDGQRAVKALKTLGITATIEGAHVRSVISADLIAPEQIVRQLVELGIGVQSFTLLAPTLEERFVGLTGEGFDVAR